jgi:protein O-GlcNAc transferase
LVNAGRQKEAVSVYRKALTLTPESPMLRFHLANLLRKQKKFSEAAGFYEEALKIKPDFKEAQDSLAEVREKR